MKYLITFSVFIISVIYAQDLATWKNGSISLQEFENDMLLYVHFNSKENAIKSSMQDRRKHLRGMIMKKLIMKLADDMNIDTVQTLKSAYSGRIFALAKKTLNNDSITNKFISEEMIKTAYNETRYIYRPFHILLRGNSEDIETKINDLFSQIAGNSSNFIKIAKLYSDDKQTSVKGGYLGWFSTVDLVQDFSKVIKDMKIGDISKPFKTQFGWHIVYLEDRKLQENPKPYEIAREKLIKSLINKDQNRFNLEYQKFISQIFSKYNFNLDTLNLINTVNLYNTYAGKGNPTLGDPINHFNKEQIALPIATSSHGNYSVNDLLLSLKEIPIEQRTTLSNSEQVLNSVIGHFKDKFFGIYLDDLGYLKRKDIRNLAKMNMIFDYKDYFINTEVRSKLSEISEKEIAKYYNEHRNEFEQNGKILSLDGARARIKSFLQKPLLSKLETDWEEYLFRRYSLKIDQELLEVSFDDKLDFKQ